jgi:hypothetical protein
LDKTRVVEGKTAVLKRKLILMYVLLLTLTACAQFSPVDQTSTPQSGIEGTVTEGPMCPGPVHIGDNTCPNQPYQATIIVLNAQNVVVAQFQTDTKGIFQIMLPPETYILRPISGKPLPRAADQIVEVTSGQFTQVSIVYDTGMR